MKIVFFNHYHNGDIHCSREFVKDVASKIPHKSYEHWHVNHPLTLKDIVDKSKPSTNTKGLDNLDRHMHKPLLDKNTNTLYINTWIGQGGHRFHKVYYCSLEGLYEIFKNIYAELNIKIEPMEYYIPSINFNKLDLNHTKLWLQQHSKPKVLICNGIIRSGQTKNWDMHKMTYNIANQNPDVEFIITENFSAKPNNTFFTGDINQLKECDLNEISFLSTHCKVIIGRASGPGAFTFIKENFFNKDLTFIAFNQHSKKEGLWFQGDTVQCKQVFLGDFEGGEDSINQNIGEIIKGIS